MEQIRKILVCIDGSTRDARLLGFAGTISQHWNTKQVHLLHVAPQPDDGSDVPPPADVVPEITSQSLRAAASEHFHGHGDEEIVAEVRTGFPLLEILRHGNDRDIDLVILGRRPQQEGDAHHEASLARRVTRKATCSVLVVPENAAVKADTIIVPVRYSECSANALAIACRIAERTNADVVCLNVFQVHSGYSRVGTTLEEHQMVLEQAAKHECEKLLKEVDHGEVNVSTLCVPDLSEGPVPLILKSIDEQSADLVVIGARGRSGAAGVLLGNITEQLIQKGPVPLLAAKKKGECIGVLRALLTIAGYE